MLHFRNEVPLFANPQTYFLPSNIYMLVSYILFPWWNIDLYHVLSFLTPEMVQWVTILFVVENYQLAMRSQ